MSITLEQYQQEADKGNVEAMLVLGTTYFNGVDGGERDMFLSAEWYEKAAIAGSFKGMVMAFNVYKIISSASVAIGPPDDALVDLEKTEYWLRKAIENGYNPKETQGGAESLYANLGDCYYYCKRYKEAFKSYKKAITHDSAVRMAVIAVGSFGAIDSLNLTNNDNIEAFRRLSNALPSDELSKELNALGFELLGDMFLKGIGVQKNPKEARILYKQAVQLGNSKAKVALKKLNRQRRIVMFVVTAIVILGVWYVVMRN